MNRRDILKGVGVGAGLALVPSAVKAIAPEPVYNAYANMGSIRIYPSLNRIVDQIFGPNGEITTSIDGPIPTNEVFTSKAYLYIITSLLYNRWNYMGTYPSYIDEFVIKTDYKDLKINNLIHPIRFNCKSFLIRRKDISNHYAGQEYLLQQLEKEKNAIVVSWYKYDTFNSIFKPNKDYHSLYNFDEFGNEIYYHGGIPTNANS